MVKKTEDGASLLGAGGHGRPDTFTPAAAGLAAGALRNPSVDDHKPKRSLDELEEFLRNRATSASSSAMRLFSATFSARNSAIIDRNCSSVEV